MADKEIKTGDKKEEACTISGCGCKLTECVSKVQCLDKKVIAIAAAVIVVLLVVLMSGGGSNGSGGLMSSCDVVDAPFSSDKWKAAKFEEGKADTTRISMAKALTEKTFYKGMAKPQVIGLLGQPVKGKFDGKYGMVYVLGSDCGQLDDDTNWLVFTMKGSKVESWEVITAPYK